MMSMIRRTEIPALPCPECRYSGVGGMARIGNRRGTCRTCNNFSANVRRITMTRLKANHAEEYEKTRLRVEVDLYPQVIEEWEARP